MPPPGCTVIRIVHTQFPALKHGGAAVCVYRQVSEVLYSCSLSDEDMDNFLNHSCDPTCRGVIRDDFTVLLYARRDIAPGESITVDYEQFEVRTVGGA